MKLITTLFIYFLLGFSSLTHAQYPVFDEVNQLNARIYAMETDSQGNLYTIGNFSGSVDFDSGIGTFNLVTDGLYKDCFVTKYDEFGNFIWAFRFGGYNSEDIPSGITIDNSDNLVITGKFYGNNVDFDPGVGVSLLAATNTFYAAFVLKVDSNANFLWAQKIGGTGDVVGNSITVDAQNNVFIAGHFKNTADFDPGSNTQNYTSLGGFDVFLLKLSSAGQYQFVNTYGSSEDDYASGIDYGSTGVYTSAHFKGTIDLEPDPLIITAVNSVGSTDIVISRFSEVNGSLIWTKSFGGLNDEYSYGVKVDSQGNCYSIGKHSLNIDFDPSPSGIFNLDVGGVYASFIHKLDVNGNFSWVKSINTSFYSIAGIEIDQNDNIYYGGSFSGATIDLDPNAGIKNYNLAGWEDFFVSSVDMNGNLIWAYAMGGIGSERGYAIDVTADGNVYVAGAFSSSTDFDPSANIYSLSPIGTEPHFVLRLNKCDQTVSNLNVSACDQYTINDVYLGDLTFTNSGLYTVTQLNSSGCDSVIYLNLTINHPAIATENEVSCDQFVWPANGNIYTSSGTYYDTIQTVFGCDSIQVLNLTIKESSLTNIYVTACDSYFWNNSGTYLVSGNYTMNYTNAAGCDSTIVLNLTINQSSATVDSQVSCNSYTWIDGNTYTSNNNSATYTLVNSNGCDSTITLDLTILPTHQDTFNETVCDAYYWIQKNQTYTQTGVYYDTLTNQYGCDSIVILNLTVRQSSTTTINVNTCDSYFWDNSGLTYFNSGMYTVVLTNVMGCDSTLVLNLVINTSKTYTETQVACGSYTWIDGNTYTSSNNTATHLLTTVSGCDSLITLNLTINNSSAGVDTHVACGSFTWIDGNTYTSANNVATFTLVNANGCDSIVTLDLTVIATHQITYNETACESYYWTQTNQTYTQTGMYDDTLTNQFGCDSIIRLNLTINNSSNGIDTLFSCGPYTWIDGNTYTSNNNTATFVIPNAEGCDSLVTLNLTVNNSSSGVDTQIACDSYTWIDGNTYTTNNNTATFVIPNAMGCDSTVTLNLTINSLNPSISLVNDTLFSNTFSSLYAWIDCSNGLEIAGESNSYFLPQSTGSYAVITSDLNCSDTSDCFLFDLSGKVELNTIDVKIVPNPFNDRFVIVSTSIINGIKIHDLSGKIVYENNSLSKNQVEYDVTFLEKGTYFVRFELNGKIIEKQLIKIN